MFAYCANDPVNNEDPDGDIAWWVGAAVGGAAAGGAITGVLFGGAGKVVSKGVRALKSARAAKKLKPIYSKHVLKRMSQDKFHRFPSSFEKKILSGKPIKRTNGRTEYLRKGYVNGKKGVYHITLDKGGKVMKHRAFIPESDWTRYSKRWKLPSYKKVKG